MILSHARLPVPTLPRIGNQPYCSISKRSLLKDDLALAGLPPLLFHLIYGSGLRHLSHSHDRQCSLEHHHVSKATLQKLFKFSAPPPILNKLFVTSGVLFSRAAHCSPSPYTHEEAGVVTSAGFSYFCRLFWFSITHDRILIEKGSRTRIRS
jgi:hypothetical protein